MKPRFRAVCKLKADLSGLRRSLVPQLNPITGVNYYTVSFTVAVHFGDTTLKANLRWYENVSVEPNQTHQRKTEYIDIRVNCVKDQYRLSPTP